MEYSNKQVRRQDRLLDVDRARELLRESEWGVLSICTNEGEPYGVPINYVWDGNNSIYLHCAPQGRKLQILEENSRVSFTVVGRVNLLPSRFTTEYESILLEGEAVRHLDDDEKHHALELLLDKLSPNDKKVGLKYAAASFHRVEIIRVDFTRWSGKRKEVF